MVDEQNGFRPRRACIDHINSITSIIRNRRNKNLDTYICFVDMSKAFDHLDRHILFNTLKNDVNIGSNIYNAIKSLYNNTCCRILLNDYSTDYFDVISGVKQGDVLSTTLFAIYINSLAKEVKSLNKGINIAGHNVSILLYADDIALISESEQNLQSMLNCLHQWCIDWRMSINQTKTKVVHFRKSNKTRTDYTFTCGTQDISITDQYKYLGCVLQENLDYTFTSKILSDAASRALGSLINKLKQNNGLYYKTYTTLYDKCICTISDYCSGVWGFKDYNHPNNLHHRAIRAFLGVHRYASTVVLNGDMGWIPPNIRRKLNMIRLWYRLEKLPDTRLTKTIYLWDKTVTGHTWYNEIKKIFVMTDQLHLFNNSSQYSLRTVIDNVKNSLMDRHVQSWKH